jgi:hypothetical protein
MHSFKFTLLAVLSYVAVIGATPLGNRAPAEAIDRRQEYVPLTTALGGSDLIENTFPARPAGRTLCFRAVGSSALTILMTRRARGTVPITS